MGRNFERAKRAWKDHRGLLGIISYGAEEFFEPGKHKEARDNELYWEQRNRELAQEARIREAEHKLPETIQRYGGRVALVTNFGHYPGVSGPREIGVRITEALIERGFGETEELTVNSLTSIRKFGRANEFQRSRVFLRDGFKALMPQLGHISSNDLTHYPGEYNRNLPLGVLGDKLAWNADFDDEKHPGAKLGYVCVVSALELNPFDQRIEFSFLGAYGEDYERVRFGGALMFNSESGGWEQVAPGNQFKLLPAELQKQSRQEPSDLVF